MKTSDFRPQITSSKLHENFTKQFGKRVNLERYNREQLEDMRNKLRTRVFQYEGTKGFNDLLHNESYQQDKAMLELLNTRIKEMLGEDIKKLRDKMVELSEGKKGVKVAKHPRKSKGTDQTGDGKKDFDDVQVARMVAGGVPKKKAIAKATSDNFKEAAGEAGDKERKPAKTKERDATLPSGAKVKIRTVQGWQSQKADKNSDKEKDLDEGKFKEDNGDRKPPKETSRTVKMKKQGGGEVDVDVRKVQGWQSQKADKNSDKEKDLDEGKHPSDCECHECATMEGKDEGKPGKNFKKIAKQGKLEESNFKAHVRMVNEGLSRLLAEDEEGKAKAITAAGDMVNDFTSWMQRVGQYQTKSMIELADAIKADFGAQEAEQFKQAVAPALSQTLEVLTQQREAISGAVAVLAGEQTAIEPMGAEPGIEAGAPDMMNPEPAGDEFGASDAAAGGAETAGRAMRESKEQRRARKLAEAHSLMAKLAK